MLRHLPASLLCKACLYRKALANDRQVSNQWQRKYLTEGMQLLYAVVTETAGFLAGAVVQPLVCNQGLVSDLCSRESVAEID